MTAATEFKLKYTGSALGYVWSIVKPLAYFAVLWVVFGRFFKLGAVFDNYPLYLILGIVLWTFFVDATTLAMASLVARSGILRKMAFPRIVVPISATMVSVVTFAINFVVVAAFLVISREMPRPAWLLVPVLLVELYVFTLGLSLILATLFVRFRDVGQIWELVTQLLFFASPIMYPLGLLPPWARSVSMLNPFTQVVQDVRSLFMPNAPPRSILVAPEVLGAGGRIYPIVVSLVVFAAGLLLFRREEPWVAERI
ncbi:MAG: type transport system permease protein [Actinomycetota bacterium]